jgi:hypothetical protein
MLFRRGNRKKSIVLPWSGACRRQIRSVRWVDFFLVYCELVMSVGCSAADWHNTRACTYLLGHVYKRLSRPSSTTVSYVHVIQYPRSQKQISICGYLGSETTFQNLDNLAEYKGKTHRTVFALPFNSKVTSLGKTQLIFLHGDTVTATRIEALGTMQPC